MRGKKLLICEVCGGTRPSGAPDFIVFHCLTFCSPDCHDDYRAADEARRVRKETAAAGSVSSRKRARAA